MSNPRTLIFWFGRVLTLGVAASALVAVTAALAASTAGPTVRTNRHCYLVGQKVTVTGSGFAASRGVGVSIDSVDFGQSSTDAAGRFAGQLAPGGPDPGHPQGVDHLLADDGVSHAVTTFTVTDRIGARFTVAHGNPLKLRAPFEVWDFSMRGSRLPVYLHYVSASGGSVKTLFLGRTEGQCGYLKTGAKQLFPFVPAIGHWVLQLDSQKHYARQPRGPVTRIKVRISG